MTELYNPHEWQERWHAQKQAIQAALGFADNVGNQSVPRIRTIMSLLQGLGGYAEQRITFLLKMLDLQRPEGVVTPHPNYPREYILRSTINQVAYDYEVILRALLQRMPGSHNTAMSGTLEIADVLAQRALDPMVGPSKRLFVLTYFQKAASIRLIPYANIALVAIPITATLRRSDLLVIPHEIGHMVYRHGASPVLNFMQQNIGAVDFTGFSWAAEKSYLDNWVEEIFADVFSALVAGPLTARSFQDVLTEGDVSEFSKDDGEHPLPALRYDIYHQSMTSKRLANSSSFTAVYPLITSLQARWEQLCDARPRPSDFVPAKPADEVGSAQSANKIRIADAKLKIAEAVNKILDAIDPATLAKAPLWGNADAQPWGSPTLDAPQPLYAGFTEFAETQYYADYGGHFPELQPGDCLPYKGPLYPPTFEYEWVNLATDRGWVTEGPGPSNLQPGGG